MYFSGIKQLVKCTKTGVKQGCYLVKNEKSKKYEKNSKKLLTFRNDCSIMDKLTQVSALIIEN